MDDEAAVRVVLGVGREVLREARNRGFSGKQLVEANSKLSRSSGVSSLNDFNASEILNNNLADSKLSIHALKREFKKNGVDFYFRELPNNQTEVLFHAKDKNMIAASTDKVLQDVKQNPKKYTQNEKILKNQKKGPTLKQRLEKAMHKHQGLLKSKVMSVGKMLGKGKSL